MKMCANGSPCPVFRHYHCVRLTRSRFRYRGNFLQSTLRWLRKETSVHQSRHIKLEQWPITIWNLLQIHSTVGIHNHRVSHPMYQAVASFKGFRLSISVFIAANTSGRSPQKTIIFIFKNYVFRVNVSQKHLIWFWKLNHWCWCLLLMLVVPQALFASVDLQYFMFAKLIG